MKIIIAFLAVITLCVVISTTTTFVRRADFDLVSSLAFELAQERAAHRANIAKANAQIERGNAEIKKANAEIARLAQDVNLCPLPMPE